VDKIATSLGINLLALKIEIRVGEIAHADFLYNVGPRREHMIRNVTLIGLGSMEVGIAQNLLKAGFELTVYNRTIAKSEALARFGAHVAASPRESAQKGDIVITMTLSFRLSSKHCITSSAHNVQAP
jgi:shikimate 5-dehydrogenase